MTRLFFVVIQVLAGFVVTTSYSTANLIDDAKLDPSIQLLLGLQHGTGINYGFGAIDSTDQKNRSTLSLAVKPGLKTQINLPNSHIYSGVSLVAATTSLDGEISGQVAKSGDQALDFDHSYIGWKNSVLDISVGAQDFTIGDGFIIGDGNYNQGAENGQYWIGAFSAWRNSFVVRLNFKKFLTELFWLRTDNDFRDGRIVGANFEYRDDRYGELGISTVHVLEGDAFNLRGMQAWSFRVADFRPVRIKGLKFFGEWVLQKGVDDQAGGRKNAAFGWYIENEYHVPLGFYTPIINYRYSNLSGDDLETEKNEGYRGLYYTIFKRGWDTWYQGEIAGEYHLFNSNQITQMFKLKLPLSKTSFAIIYYYDHELHEKHYFNRRVNSKKWSSELNLGLEQIKSSGFYGYFGVALSKPRSAAKEVFGNDDFFVVQTFLSYNF